jgi:D-inositol-3-phosphate glycosyltransferase
MGPRIAMVSVHTSPLDQPGTGDAGGMNVYLASLARALGEAGATVDIFTRATAPDAPRVVPLGTGVTVRHVPAGPLRRLRKEDLPGRVRDFAAQMLQRAALDATREVGRHVERPYDVVHSHYWLSGLAAGVASPLWAAPLVHTMHTLAKVKNAALAPGDAPEPAQRERGEESVVRAAHALVASTHDEADDLVRRYGAEPAAVHVVAPGVDRAVFHPDADVPDAAALAAAQRRARRELGLDPDEPLVLFAGRVQPLKAPDVLVRALAVLTGQVAAGTAALRQPARLVVLGGPSGDAGRLDELAGLARSLGMADRVDLRRPVDPATLARWYRAADVVAVPSRSESYGLVAAEAQACGTPVVAADVGGLRSVVRDGVSGVLVPGHAPATWARVLGDLLADPRRRLALGEQGARHAGRRGWDAAAEAMLAVYRRARERAALVAA